MGSALPAVEDAGSHPDSPTRTDPISTNARSIETAKNGFPADASHTPSSMLAGGRWS